MAQYIDENFWKDALLKPTWYLLIDDDFRRLEKLADEEKDEARRKEIKRRPYELVEAAIKSGTLPMASAGDDLDAERKPIDTIVIHHTNNKPGMTLERLNAMHLLRIYGQNSAHPPVPKEAHLRGMPIWSNHFYKSKQVFWGYHWIVREDGTAEQILDDRYIGWHAGDWDINTRSIGICIDDNLTHKEPGEAVLDAIANIVRIQYPGITAKNIIGHSDANKGTICPGSMFHKDWKPKLLRRLIV